MHVSVSGDFKVEDIIKSEDVLERPRTDSDCIDYGSPAKDLRVEARKEREIKIGKKS